MTNNDLYRRMWATSEFVAHTSAAKDVSLVFPASNLRTSRYYKIQARLDKVAPGPDDKFDGVYIGPSIQLPYLPVYVVEH